MMVYLDSDESVETQIARQIFHRMDKEEWQENYKQLCMHCEAILGCDLVEGMLEYLNDERDSWPENAWRYCEHSGATCDSFQPLEDREKRELPDELPPMCQGCAGRTGTPASQTVHTSREFAAAVENGTAFHCHEVPGQLCGGWCCEREKLNRKTATS